MNFQFWRPESTASGADDLSRQQDQLLRRVNEEMASLSGCIYLGPSAQEVVELIKRTTLARCQDFVDRRYIRMIYVRSPDEASDAVAEEACRILERQRWRVRYDRRRHFYVVPPFYDQISQYVQAVRGGVGKVKKPIF